MAQDYAKIAHEVLEAVGGKENVNSATNCMTRLRLTVADQSKVDMDAIKKINGVLGAQWSGAQLQVIIGQSVPKVLAEFCKESGVAAGTPVDENLDAPKEKLTAKGVLNKIMDFMSGSMTPLIPLLMGSGLFRTIAVIIGPLMLGLVTEEDPAYIFFYTTLFEAGMYFMPIYLGYTSAKKMGASPVLGMLLGGVLIAPSIISAAGADGSGIISVYGIQIQARNYSQTVLPIMLTTPVLYVVEKWFKKVIPDTLSTIFTPFFTLAVVIPIELIALAPLGNFLGQGIAAGLFFLANLGGLGSMIFRGIIGAFWQLFVIFGMHMPIILLAQVEIIQTGYDPIVFVSTNCAMFAVWGCAIGAFLRCKGDQKSLCGGYIIAALAGGVTEPTLFGLLMKYRRTMLGMFIGGAAGAIVSGLFSVTYYISGGGTNFTVFLNYLQGGTGNLVGAVVGCVVSVVVAAIVVFLTGFSKDELEAMKEE